MPENKTVSTSVNHGSYFGSNGYRDMLKESGKIHLPTPPKKKAPKQKPRKK